MKGLETLRNAISKLDGQNLFEFTNNGRHFAVIASEIHTKTEYELGEYAEYKYRMDIVQDTETKQTWIVPTEKLYKYGRK